MSENLRTPDIYVHRMSHVRTVSKAALHLHLGRVGRRQSHVGYESMVVVVFV
jgi:hypothetical protein